MYVCLELHLSAPLVFSCLFSTSESKDLRFFLAAALFCQSLFRGFIFKARTEPTQKRESRRQHNRIQKHVVKARLLPP